MADSTQSDRDQDVVAYQAFSGLRNDVNPERFGPGDLELALNVDLDKSGQLSRRDGYTNVATGAKHSLWSDDAETMCLFVDGNQLMLMQPDYSGMPLTTLTGLDLRMSYTKVNDTVYFSNGVDIGVLENGAVRSWGLQVPTLPGVALTVGAMPAGDYQFTMTFFRADGQESGAPLAGLISVPAGTGLAFTLPVSPDPTVTSKAIYLSTPNGNTLYLAVLTGNQATSAFYANDTNELTLPCSTQFLGPPPPGQLVAYYRGRAYTANGDLLYPSSSFGYELFDQREYIQLDGRVTLLAIMEDKERLGEGQHSGFFVGTDRTCGTIVGTEPQDFQYIPKTTFGAVFGAMDYVDGSIFADGATGARMLPMWLTTQGICVGMPDMDIRNLTRTKYMFPASGQGAAVFMPGPNRFIATSNF